MIKNLQFGLLPPSTHADLIIDQMRLANIYRNKLVDIELQRREQADAALLAASPELRALKVQLDEQNTIVDGIYETQRKRNAKARRNIPRTEEENIQLQAAKKVRGELYNAWSVLRKKLFRDPKLKPRLDNIDKETTVLMKRERAHCGLYWGTYQLVEDAAAKFREGAPPKHKPFRGAGRVGVQIQNGMRWDAVLASAHTQLRVSPVPPPEQRYSKKGVALPMPGPKRQQKQRRLFMRIGSDGVAPIFADWPMFLHFGKVAGQLVDRIPPDSLVKRAFVNRKIVAGRERWCVTFTLNIPNALSYQPVATAGACGIDVGYRAMPDGGMRVALLVGDDGHTEDLRIDANHLDQFSKIDELQSIRDNNFNEIRGVLRDFMDSAGDVPEWLTEECATMHAWRRIARLVVLLRRWKAQRFAGDEMIFDRMVAWSDQEYHLWQWQENLRDQLQAWRKDLYRNFARRAASRYRTVAVEDLDLRELHDVKVRPEERETPTALRVSARRADLSTLFMCLKDAAGNLKELPAAYTTTTCHACGNQCDWDKAQVVVHTCEHCGVVWDQDHNAAKNLLAASVNPVAPAPEKKKTRGERLVEAKRRKRDAKKDDHGEGPRAVA